MNCKETTEEQIRMQTAELAKRWLAMDGLWFQAVENRFGIETAIVLDKEVWRRFSPIEATRIMRSLGIEPGGGLDALAECLKYRCYAYINRQEIDRVSPGKLVLKMVECRVQEARNRKNMAPFPCKAVGVVEYSEFAKAIDPRITVECLACPPDDMERDFWCGWEFTLEA